MKELINAKIVEIERTPKTTKRYQIKYFNKKGKLVPVNDHEYKYHVALDRLKRFQKRFKDQELQLVEAD